MLRTSLHVPVLCGAHAVYPTCHLSLYLCMYGSIQVAIARAGAIAPLVALLHAGDVLAHPGPNHTQVQTPTPTPTPTRTPTRTRTRTPTRTRTHTRTHTHTHTLTVGLTLTR